MNKTTVVKNWRNRLYQSSSASVFIHVAKELKDWTITMEETKGKKVCERYVRVRVRV